MKLLFKGKRLLIMLSVTVGVVGEEQRFGSRKVINVGRTINH
jgi:hypothetical protein